MEQEKENPATTDALVLAGIEFLRTVKQYVGPDACGDAASALRPILGNSWSNALLAVILRDGLGGNVVRVTFVPQDQRIPFIKEIRVFTGKGLYESKLLADDYVEFGQVDIPSHDNEAAKEFIRTLRKFGAIGKLS